MDSRVEKIYLWGIILTDESGMEICCITTPITEIFLLILLLVESKHRGLFTSYVPTFHDPVHVEYSNVTSLTVTEDDFGNLSLSQEAIRDLTFHPVEKVDEEKIGDGLTLTFSLIEEMHQDANLSIFKQRRYRVTTLDESIFGTKIDKDIIIDHETYSKIWAHLISDKARRMKIQLKLGKPPKENYWRWRLKTLSDLFKFQPPRVGDFLKRGDNLALNSWHTIPYFSHSETSIISMNNDRVQIESKHEDSFLFLYHLSNDRILEGCNFNLIPKRATSSFRRYGFLCEKAS